MIVNTEHGEFECNEISRKERRRLYRRVKEGYANENLADIHDLADEFAIIAFGDEKKAESVLMPLSALEEDEVLMVIINAYMGFENPTETGG